MAKKGIRLRLNKSNAFALLVTEISDWEVVAVTLKDVCSRRNLIDRVRMVVRANMEPTKNQKHWSSTCHVGIQSNNRKAASALCATKMSRRPHQRPHDTSCFDWLSKMFRSSSPSERTAAPRYEINFMKVRAINVLLDMAAGYTRRVRTRNCSKSAA